MKYSKKIDICYCLLLFFFTFFFEFEILAQTDVDIHLNDTLKAKLVSPDQSKTVLSTRVTLIWQGEGNAWVSLNLTEYFLQGGYPKTIELNAGDAYAFSLMKAGTTFNYPGQLYFESPADSIFVSLIDDKNLLLETAASRSEFRKKVKSAIVNLINNMVKVPAGSFVMGWDSAQIDSVEVLKIRYLITLDAFSIGKFEVTQLEWFAVMGSNPSFLVNCWDCPVENISFSDVERFISKLNELTGYYFRLPTEKEWEYAARGGGKTINSAIFSGSDNVGDVAWYNDNCDDDPKPVGLKNPNILGIFDMSGNVWEWCSDWFKDYPGSTVIGDFTGVARVARGGSFARSDLFCRVSFRAGHKAESGSPDIGFRLVLVP